MVQVNGKLRERIRVPIGITREEAERLALESPRVQTYVNNKKVEQLVYVPGRLVNVVVK